MRTLITLLILSTCAPAYAQQNTCGPIEDMLGKLRQMGEERIWTGIQYDDRALYSLYVNQDHTAWTILTLMPSGIACVYKWGHESNSYLPKFGVDN